MAKFDVPFANTGPRRNPTADERANGFPCGAADQLLFNGMFHRIEAELGDLLTYAGLTPTDTDFTQVRQAVLALIAASTGGGEPQDYLLVSQVQARMPIYPDFQTADGRINVTSPANGTIRLPGNVTFIHRGILPVTTVQTDFATVSSQTYHLRWSPTGGYALKNVGDNGYNPGALAETNVAFDTTFDDMLIARIITNAGNVPTITTLANKDRLFLEGETAMQSTQYGAGGVTPVEVNFARRPRVAMRATRDIRGKPDGTGEESDIGIYSLNRYVLNAFYRRSVLFGGSADNGAVDWSAWL